MMMMVKDQELLLLLLHIGDQDWCDAACVLLSIMTSTETSAHEKLPSRFHINFSGSHSSLIQNAAKTRYDPGVEILLTILVKDIELFPNQSPFRSSSASHFAELF